MEPHEITPTKPYPTEPMLEASLGSADAYVVADLGREEALPLDGDVIVVGRASDAHIRLTETDVSRHHCRFRRVHDGFVLEDLDSRNGTYRNGHRITATCLFDGDRIQVGLTSALTFRTALKLR
jgi:pSer/pThr/pTyr-binding forkhead associated (FHA) protein